MVNNFLDYMRSVMLSVEIPDVVLQYRYIEAIARKWSFLNRLAPCQSLELRLILSTTIYRGQAEFRVGGDYTTVNEYI